MANIVEEMHIFKIFNIDRLTFIAVKPRPIQSLLSTRQDFAFCARPYSYCRVGSPSTMRIWVSGYLFKNWFLLAYCVHLSRTIKAQTEIRNFRCNALHGKKDKIKTSECQYVTMFSLLGLGYALEVDVEVEEHPTHQETQHRPQHLAQTDDRCNNTLLI